LSGRIYDIIIVGAGPAGSYAAYELASSGYTVAVLEEKSTSGLDVCCTGIISTECFQALDASPDTILTRVNSASFFSPSGRCLRIQTEDVQACVVNRVILDRAMASKAQTKGAEYYFSAPVMDITHGKDSIQAETFRFGAKEKFIARAIVLANGFKPKFTQKLNMGRINHFLVGAQAEIEVRNVDGFEIYFGQETAPGAFAWLVPTSANKAYLGLLAVCQAKVHLQKLLDRLYRQGRIVSQEAEIGQKAVPVATLSRTYGDRILVIGDAAGQVKPTTGGGIYFGNIGARLAAQVLHEALTCDDLTARSLSRYQKRWKARIGKELSRGFWARWAYGKLSDHQIDRIFDLVASNGMTETLLNSGKFSFDWHSKSILTVLRHSSTYPMLRIRDLFLREAST
jgi:geranylgeranyl reductase family protein